MSIFESVISIFAPHKCISCGIEGTLLCLDCWPKIGEIQPERCFKCNKFSEGNITCKACRRVTKLDRVWIRSEFTDVSKSLVHHLKFKRAKQASVIIAVALAEILPPQERNIIVVPVPTASSRRRQRGYDQSELIAKHVSRMNNLPFSNLLARIGQSRQVSTKKIDRQKQMINAFRVQNKSKLYNSRIILVDDVLTTGATLESAANTLKKHGAKSVSALVFARTSLN